MAAMWEDATPPQPDGESEQMPPRKGADTRSEDNLVLWAQLILCGLMLAGILAARALQLPIFAELRVAYTAALAADDSGLLDEERSFVHFAQQTLDTLGQAAREVLAQLRDDPAGSAASPAPDQENSAPADADAASSVAGISSYAAEPAARNIRGKPTAAPTGSSLKSYRPPFLLADPLGGGYRTTSPYGWRTDPVTGKGSDFHKGVDLAVAEGTPVTAAAAGVVRRAGYNRSYGNYLRILHENGDETLYAHLQYLFVRAGEPVTMGQTLGTVGQTGNATGPHLHFELLHEGVRYDPTQVLQSAV